MCTMCTTCINKVWIVMVGQKWQSPQSFWICKTPSLICRFATGHLIGWGKLASYPLSVPDSDCVNIKHSWHDNKLQISEIVFKNLEFTDSMILQQFLPIKLQFLTPAATVSRLKTGKERIWFVFVDCYCCSQVAHVNELSTHHGTGTLTDFTFTDNVQYLYWHGSLGRNCKSVRPRQDMSRRICSLQLMAGS